MILTSKLALGDRRAATSWGYLVAQGVAPSGVKAVSYGEERPLAGGDSRVITSRKM